MGLDISVCKIVNRKDALKDYCYFRLVDDNGNYKNNFPEWTRKFECTKTETWYDWEKFKDETGIDIKSCTNLGECYGQDGCYVEVWPTEFGKVPEIEDFKIKDGEYNWDEYHTAINEHTVKIDLEKVPTYKKKLKVLYYNEVGYQRKGLNKKFYDDYDDGKIGYFVWNTKDLKRYKKEYCDKPYEYVYPNGEKSGEIIHPKTNFQRNIIDKFIDGECCVTFDW